jgi:16S rRNA (cytidine1402-2'-O)-methyltransferase
MYFNEYHIAILNQCRFFIVEEIRTTRRFLRSLLPQFPIDECTFLVYNEHSTNDNLMPYIQPLLNGHHVCLLSEAGMPCIADPGYLIIQLAHQYQIPVIPVPGSSSIFLALAASGLPSQSFKFNGYLPQKNPDLIHKIKSIEKESQSLKLSQIFIETPYRNQRLFNQLLATCNDNTLLCVAYNLASSESFIKTTSIKNWKKSNFLLDKHPCVFIIYAG